MLMIKENILYQKKKKCVCGSLAQFYLYKITCRTSKPLTAPSGELIYEPQLEELFRVGLWHEVHYETV